MLTRFQRNAPGVILSGVSRAFAFARSAGTRKEGLPGGRLVEPGRSSESLFDVDRGDIPLPEILRLRLAPRINRARRKARDSAPFLRQGKQDDGSREGESDTINARWKVT